MKNLKMPKDTTKHPVDSTKKQRTTRILRDLDTPSFVVNVAPFRRNCQQVIDSAVKHKLKLRPHIKTHKTWQGSLLQAGYSSTDGSFSEHVVGFVASTIPEVELLVDSAEKYKGPFLDILLAVPISRKKIRRLISLRDRMVPVRGTIRILLDNEHQIPFVEEAMRMSETKNNTPWSVFLKIDTGYHRAGTSPDEAGLEVAKAIAESPACTLSGIYSHCGHAYDVNSPKALDEIATIDQKMMLSFLTLLQKEITLPYKFTVSVGSTPSVFHHTGPDTEDRSLSPGDSDQTSSNIDFEMHPGNYTFYDRQQLWTGACSRQDNVSCRVVATVVGEYKDRNSILVDAGALALSKDSAPAGGMCEIQDFPDCKCTKASQEVLKVECPLNNDDADVPALGSTIFLVPNHSCLSAACFDKFYVIDDETFRPESEVIDEWIPAKFF